MIWLAGCPLPPSVNEYLMVIRGRLVKSPVHREYTGKWQMWALRNRATFEPIKAHLHDIVKRMEVLKRPVAFQVDCFFAFEHSRIFTLNGKIQQLDANNRLKPALDGLVSVLDIDDKYFFAGNCEKISTPTKDSECSMMRIVPMKPRTLQEVRSIMNSEMTTPASS